MSYNSRDRPQAPQGAVNIKKKMQKKAGRLGGVRYIRIKTALLSD